MDTKAFEKLYLLQLQDIYSAGKQLIEAYPRMGKASKTKELKSLFKECMEQARTQISRIENIFKKIKNTDPDGENCNSVEEFIEEIEDWLEESEDNAVIDAGLILINKKIIHYEIAVYESILSYTRILGQDKSLLIMQESLTELQVANTRFDELCEEAHGVLIK
jgi:ferritin-like metal-binding protein YciE